MQASLILRVSAPLLLWVPALVSVYLLVRGHNAPGGGFVGGLVAASGLVFHAIARGQAAALRIMRAPPAAWFAWYAKCMADSAVSETAAWSLILTVFLITVLVEMLGRGSAVPAPCSADNLIARVGSLGPWPLVFALAQLAEYAFLAVAFDLSEPPFKVSTLICYVNLGIIYAAVLFHVEQVLRSGFAAKRR
jgi:hypothetical protein